MQSHSLEHAQEQAALYALGALSAHEHEDFEAHLADGCETCAEELRAFRAVAEELGLAAAPVATRPELRERVLDRVARADAKDDAVFEKDGLHFVRQDRSGWQAGKAPGCYFKRLHHDPERQYVTQLIRMDPGTVYPAHRHADFEEIYLLDGDLLVSDVHMSAGDYCRADAGSIHTGIRSENGCLFIAMFSERNEPISG